MNSRDQCEMFMQMDVLLSAANCEHQSLEIIIA